MAHGTARTWWHTGASSSAEAAGRRSDQQTWSILLNWPQGGCFIWVMVEDEKKVFNLFLFR